MKIYQEETINKEGNPIYATAKGTNTSDNFKFQDSQVIIDALQASGFYLDSNSIGNPRKDENRGFQKHLMIFRSGWTETKIDDGNELTILVQNAHNGTSSVRFSIGIYRAVCANGLIVGDTLHEYRVNHRGKEFERNIIEAIANVRHKFTDIKAVVHKMQSTELSYEDRRNLAFEAVKVRLGKQAEFLEKVDVLKLLSSRRLEDQPKDLYTVFNRIQENVMRGKIKYLKQLEDNTFKTSSLRRIKKGSDTDIKFNSGFWNEAMKYVA
jgi:hypothetical protein